MKNENTKKQTKKEKAMVALQAEQKNNPLLLIIRKGKKLIELEIAKILSIDKSEIEGITTDGGFFKKIPFKIIFSAEVVNF
jgi:hypothetical protein